MLCLGVSNMGMFWLKDLCRNKKNRGFFGLGLEKDVLKGYLNNKIYGNNEIVNLVV